MRIPLRNSGITVPQDLLHLLQRPAKVDQHRGILMAQVVNANMLQVSLLAQPVPDLVHGGHPLQSIAAGGSDRSEGIFEISR